MSLTVNGIGGALAALALVAVIVFGASRSAFLAGPVSAQAPVKSQRKCRNRSRSWPVIWPDVRSPNPARL